MWTRRSPPERLDFLQRRVHASGVNRPPAANQNWAFMPDCDLTSWHPKWKRFSHLGGCRKRKADGESVILRPRTSITALLRTSDAFIALWAVWRFLAANYWDLCGRNTTQITASASHPRRLHTRTCALKQGCELTHTHTHTHTAEHTHCVSPFELQRSETFPLIC